MDPVKVEVLVFHLTFTLVGVPLACDAVGLKNEGRIFKMCPQDDGSWSVVMELTLPEQGSFPYQFVAMDTRKSELYQDPIGRVQHALLGSVKIVNTWGNISRTITQASLSMSRTPLDSIHDSVWKAIQLERDIQGVPYHWNRVQELGYTNPCPVSCERITNDKVYARYCSKKSSLGTQPVNVWHATSPNALESICLNGFEYREKLGKLFGKGIYNSSFLDVGLYYALKFFCSDLHSRKVFVKLILSRAVLGTTKTLNDYKEDQPFEKGIDTYHVKHTDGGRLGTPVQQATNPFDFFFKLATGTGKMTGEEVVVKDGAQLNPCYVVTFCLEKKYL